MLLLGTALSKGNNCTRISYESSLLGLAGTSGANYRLLSDEIGIQRNLSTEGETLELSR